MKLQMSVGDMTRNGKNRLANVKYIRATKKLGLPNKLKWPMIRFSMVAWIIVKANVTSTFI
ncbi:hypothetical protein D3C85_1495900 [compost metagenome]